MDDFIHGCQGALWMGRHRGRETKGSCLGPARTCWHMQTENSGNENLQNNHINHGDVLLHGIMLLFCREGKMPSARRQSQSFGHMQFDANEKISVLKLTKKPHESLQCMSCTLPQACTFGLVSPCLCQYLIQKRFMNAS
jgi:hypothetical protein